MKHIAGRRSDADEARRTFVQKNKSQTVDRETLPSVVAGNVIQPVSAVHSHNSTCHTQSDRADHMQPRGWPSWVSQPVPVEWAIQKNRKNVNRRRGWGGTPGARLCCTRGTQSAMTFVAACIAYIILTRSAGEPPGCYVIGRNRVALLTGFVATTCISIFFTFSSTFCVAYRYNCYCLLLRYAVIEFIIIFCHSSIWLVLYTRLVCV